MTVLTEAQRRTVLDKVLHLVSTKFMGADVDVNQLRATHEDRVVNASTAEDFEEALNAVLRDLKTSHTGVFSRVSSAFCRPNRNRRNVDEGGDDYRWPALGVPGRPSRRRCRPRGCHFGGHSPCNRRSGARSADCNPVSTRSLLRIDSKSALRN